MSVRMSTSRPLRCSRRFSACTATPTVSVTPIGRYWVMWFSICTEPIAAKGKSKPVTNAMTVGNVNANGYVSGTASPNRSPVTLAYAATLARSISRSSTVSVRSGSESLRGTNGRAPAAARSRFFRPEGWVTVLTLGAQPGLAADPDRVAGDGDRSRAREIGDGLGDIDGLAALIQRVQPAADLAGCQRNGLGHLCLDEAGRDGVDGDALLAELGGQRIGEADHARLGGGVIRLTAVARDTRHRRKPDDAAAVTKDAAVHQTLGELQRRKEIHRDNRVPSRVVHV